MHTSNMTIAKSVLKNAFKITLSIRAFCPPYFISLYFNTLLQKNQLYEQNLYGMFLTFFSYSKL